MPESLPFFHTRASLRLDLQRLGLAAGQVVMVHAAMRKVGPLLNGPDALIQALLDVLGPSGTLMVYTSWDSQYDDLLDEDGRVVAAWRDQVPGFAATRSRAARQNSVLAEFVRTTPGARRSGNPGASVAALGQRARWLTAAHPLNYGYGEGSPLAKLVAAGGRVLLVGAPWDTVTLVHHADHLARLPHKRVLRYEVPFAWGTGTRWRFIEEFDTTEPIVAGLPENYIEQIVTTLVATGSGQQGLVGNATSLLLEADDILRYAINWLEQWVIAARERLDK